MSVGSRSYGSAEDVGRGDDDFAQADGVDSVFGSGLGDVGAFRAMDMRERAGLVALSAQQRWTWLAAARIWRLEVSSVDAGGTPSSTASL